MDRYFEDFSAGEVFVSQGVTVTESAIVDFALLYDPQRFHIDAEAARASPYGGLIASGFQTLALVFRMWTDLGVVARCGIGSPGVEELRWLAPVRPGDTLHAVVEVLDVRASQSRPDRGIAIFGFQGRTQRDETVLSLRATVFLLRRPAP